MANLPRRGEMSNRDWLAPGGRDAHERTVCRWCEHDRAFSIPRASATRGNIRQHLRWSTADVDAIQLVRGKIADRTAVRGPERIVGAVRSRYDVGIQLIQCAQPEPLPSVD